MEKLTDEQIIKALECCMQDDSNCRECPIYERGSFCISKLFRNSLDLINRQKADVEQWKEEANKYQTLWCDLWCEPYSDIHKVKAEAIKMFAERLKAISHPYGDTQMVFELQIDNLVKEMTEGRKECEGK